MCKQKLEIHTTTCIIYLEYLPANASPLYQSGAIIMAASQLSSYLTTSVNSRIYLDTILGFVTYWTTKGTLRLISSNIQCFMIDFLALFAKTGLILTRLAKFWTKLAKQKHNFRLVSQKR